MKKIDNKHNHQKWSYHNWLKKWNSMKPDLVHIFSLKKSIHLIIDWLSIWFEQKKLKYTKSKDYFSQYYPFPEARTCHQWKFLLIRWFTVDRAPASVCLTPWNRGRGAFDKKSMWILHLHPLDSYLEKI